jgi:NAD(P) transhydrogenase
MDFDLLVIGASAAGWQVAIAAARMDRKVGLITQQSIPKTPVCDLRSVPGCLLRDVCADWPIAQRGRRISPGVEQATSWKQFADYTQRVWQQEQDTCRDQFLAAGGAVWFGDVFLSGPQSVSLKRPRMKAVELASEHLVIATGTMPHKPHFASDCIPSIRNAAWILESQDLSGDACIIGGSVTGLRAACLLALWGNRVSLVDGRVLAETVLDEDTADWYAWGHDLGVRFDTGEDVIGLKSRSPRKTEVILESGRHIVAESIWLATGRRGRTADLRLGMAGLTTDDCGRLWCDPDHQTWVPSIHAVGDVVGFPPDTGGAAETAGQIAENIFRITPSRSTLGSLLLGL